MPVILSAMIFAGVTMIVGILLGFLLGQAKSRMSYEEDLRKLEQDRAALKQQLARLRDSLPVQSPVPSPGAGSARASE